MIWTEDGTDKQRMKRVVANDPAAMCQEGGKQYKKGNYVQALQYYIKAAGLGNACIIMSKVSRRIWGRKFTIWKRLLLEVIHMLGSILDDSTWGMDMLSEQ